MLLILCQVFYSIFKVGRGSRQVITWTEYTQVRTRPPLCVCHSASTMCRPWTPLAIHMDVLLVEGQHGTSNRPRSRARSLFITMRCVVCVDS